MAMRTKPILPLLLLIPAGCALQDEALYPSLKPRAVETSERARAQPRPQTEAPAFVIPAADSQLLAQMSVELAAAERRFAAALAEADRGGSGAVAAGSEEWGTRAQAVGRLVAAQAPTAALAEQARDLLGRLNRQAVESGAALAADNPAAAFSARADAAAAGQQREIDRLAATLSG
jgi:hypothetical protein